MSDGEKLQATTDANGIARTAYSLSDEPEARYWNISVHGEGLVPLTNRWIQGPASPAPPVHLLFQMERATKIRGRVIDERGQPLASAGVVLKVIKTYAKSGQRVDINYQSTRTDQDGHWSFTNVPEQPQSVEIAIYHHLCLTDRSYFLLEPFRPLSALRDGSAVLRLRRGTTIQGTVLASNGQPVADADVYYGVGQGLGNAIPPVKTDAKGKFVLGIQPGTFATLIARVPGFGPTLQRMRVGEGPSRADLVLELARSLRGRVVDPVGDPIAHARIFAYWSGPETPAGSRFTSAIVENLTTDDDGRFEWKDAPARGVHVDVFAAGFAAKENLTLASNVDHEVMLIRPTVVKGTVTDRETGQPLPRFTLSMAVAPKHEDSLVWLRKSDLDRTVKKAPGAFEYESTAPTDRQVLRVQAEGYLSEDSDPFSPDGKVHRFAFRLTRAEPIRGIVQAPDRSAVRVGLVCLVPSHRDGWNDQLYLRNDDITEGELERNVSVKIGADGRFVMPPQRENFALLVLADAGFALVSRDDLQAGNTLLLKAWARVSGRVTIDGKPAAGLVLESHDPEGSAPVSGEIRLVHQRYVKTDSDGKFELPRVMPGRLKLVEWLNNGVEGRIWPLERATVDVESGRTHELRIGASGRLVTGRVVLPHADEWMIRKAEIIPKDSTDNRPVTVGVELLEGGKFRALDLKPGDYRLNISLHEPPPPNSCGWGRLLSEYAQDFRIPADAREANAPFELGEIQSVTQADRPLQVGDRAPDFAIKTLEGRDLRLADFRGRYVLLDFWATWCGPCMGEMPNLVTLQNRFGQNPRFALLGISLDERPSMATDLVKELKLSWVQGFAGPDADLVSAYGASAIPATFLIGPDGKILARDLRGEQTQIAVAEALKP
ncbi:redoxin domain-containing protein [Singulisphaera sp. GP187]|uniref:redoxin domain-containing protein n=1 Tax=Singulisphaera sp. GP187 TaxID=1882752 RepID=UPI0013564542|nr:redoxin domain-containing protein [Singulisphaera sp. GP187]